MQPTPPSPESRPPPMPAHKADRHSYGCATQRLAQAFVREPELVLACLQGIETEPAEKAERILAAARVAQAECPEYADLSYQVAQAAIAAGQHGAAAAALEHALALNPTYKDALILAARVAAWQKQPRQAQGFLDRALAAGADYPDVHMLRGSLWREQGDRWRAQAAYQRALELNANLRPARTALAALSQEEDGESNELPA